MQYFILQSLIVHLSWFTDKINHTKFFMSPTIHTTLSTTLLATIAIIQYQDSFIFWLHDKRCSKTLQHGPSQTTINYLLKEIYSMRLEIWDLKMGVGVDVGGGGWVGRKILSVGRYGHCLELLCTMLDHLDFMLVKYHTPGTHQVQMSLVTTVTSFVMFNVKIPVNEGKASEADRGYFQLLHLHFQ